jgi:hypothetical protein
LLVHESAYEWVVPGADIDAGNDYSNEGDYTKTHADDEEDNVGVEQVGFVELSMNLTPMIYFIYGDAG